MKFIKRHPVAFTLLSIFLILLILAGMWAFKAYRTMASAAFTPATPWEMQAPQEPIGEQNSSASYFSEVIALSTTTGESSLNTIAVGWDDSWFNQSPFNYNQGLASFCIAASAMANGESYYYTGMYENDLAVELLSPLGFTDIDTSSYEYGSYIEDEINNALEGKTDVVSFVMAHKQLPAQDGAAPQELIIVIVRGTYGTEWLSNFKINSQYEELQHDDHSGYLIAASRVLTDLQKYYWEHGIDPMNTKLLVTGHSRGDSVAGNIAELAIDLSYVSGDMFISSIENIYAYCFATSPNTKSADAHNARYAGIFNILNPNDLVPLIPFSEWDFTYWGKVGYLPSTAQEGYDDLQKTMNKTRAYNTGYIGIKPFNEDETNPTWMLRDELAQTLPTVKKLGDAGALAKALEIVTNYDMMRILSEHCPDTYIAWLQTISSEQITWKSA